MTKARAIADIHAGLVLATADIRAPIDRVFSALTDPNELPKWWGQADMYQTTAMTADLRTGGQWRTDGVGVDGAPFHVGGVYTAVEAPHRVEFTWKPSWEEIETHVSYTLQAIEGGTRVTARHTGFGDHAAACDGHANGWERVLGWLSVFVEGEAAPVPAWFVKLKAPRPSFAFDMTPDEMAVMQAHSAYWRAKLAGGQVVVFGPVADPAGAFGLGIVRADETALKAFQDNDPAILSGRGFSYEAFPMLSAITL